MNNNINTFLFVNIFFTHYIFLAVYLLYKQSRVLELHLYNNQMQTFYQTDFCKCIQSKDLGETGLL
jgi:hypothetical protein